MSGAHRPNYGDGQRAELREIAMTAGAQALGAAIATAGAAYILTRMFKRQEEAHHQQPAGGGSGQHLHVHIPQGANPDAWAPVLTNALQGGVFTDFASSELEELLPLAAGEI